jgi:hypothetical protein
MENLQATTFDDSAHQAVRRASRVSSAAEISTDDLRTVLDPILPLPKRSPQTERSKAQHHADSDPGFFLLGNLAEY